MATRFPKISENLSGITIYGVKMRLCSLIGENIVGKYFQRQKALSLSKFLLNKKFLHLLNLSSLFAADVFKDELPRFRILCNFSENSARFIQILFE